MADLISYLITDPKYYSNKPHLFKQNLQKAFNKNKIDMACFRDKQSENFEQLAKIFVEVCEEFKIKKILINNNIDLALKLGINAIHLTSKQFNEIKKAKDLDFYTIISCHNKKELQEALILGANAVTYSPIFDTPNKGEAKGIKDLQEITNLYKNLKIIALGGIISEEQIKEIKKTKAYGFASIRYFT